MDPGAERSGAERRSGCWVRRKAAVAGRGVDREGGCGRGVRRPRCAVAVDPEGREGEKVEKVAVGKWGRGGVEVVLELGG